MKRKGQRSNPNEDVAPEGTIKTNKGMHMRKNTTYLIFLGIVFCLLSTDAVYANGSNDHDRSDESPEKHDWKAPPEEVKRPNPISSSLESIQRGKALFGNSCVGCHGKEAKGDGPAAKNMKPKPTDLSAMAGLHTDGDFAWKIATGKDLMPAWKNSLTKDQIWDMVNFIQSLKSEGVEKHSDEPHSH